MPTLGDQLEKDFAQTLHRSEQVRIEEVFRLGVLGMGCSLLPPRFSYQFSVGWCPASSSRFTATGF